ncbi:MAG: hypothetical protein LBS75_05440 [Synergistaceae bacterium]|nr:hypothetical protein [Synergistaceae bacterium]
MREALFSRRAVSFLAAWVAALFAIAVMLGVRETPPVLADSSGAGTYSISAVGCAGFYDLLQRLDFPVERGASDAASAAGDDGTLIVVEPGIQYLADGSAEDMDSATRVLIVLPKRNWSGDPKRSGWVSQTWLKSEMSVERTLWAVTNETLDVVRKEWPDEWPVNEIGREPSGAGSVQLVSSKGVRAIVGGGDGALLCELPDASRKIWVLSDPDVLANHGIVRGENARFMLEVVDRLSMWENDDPCASIVFAESVHGFGAPSGGALGDGRVTLAGLLLRFPFAVVTALICCSAALAVMAGASRFGAPRPRGPALDFGKSHLISNSARLLDYGGHHAAVIGRYVRMAMRAAASGLHAPEDMDERAAAEWLDRIGLSRGTELSCASILRELYEAEAHDRENLPRLFEIAQRISRWKGEILVGEHAIHKRNG